MKSRFWITVLAAGFLGSLICAVYFASRFYSTGECAADDAQRTAAVHQADQMTISNFSTRISDLLRERDEAKDRLASLEKLNSGLQLDLIRQKAFSQELIETSSRLVTALEENTAARTRDTERKK